MRRGKEFSSRRAVGRLSLLLEQELSWGLTKPELASNI